MRSVVTWHEKNKNNLAAFSQAYVDYSQQFTAFRNKYNEQCLSIKDVIFFEIKLTDNPMVNEAKNNFSMCIVELGEVIESYVTTDSVDFYKTQLEAHVLKCKNAQYKFIDSIEARTLFSRVDSEVFSFTNSASPTGLTERAVSAYSIRRSRSSGFFQTPASPDDHLIFYKSVPATSPTF